MSLPERALPHRPRRRYLSVVSGLALLAVCAGCFGSSAPQRSYYVLQGVTIRPQTAVMPGLVRVRDLDAASVYEKFQIVVRKSPYELRYSEENVWAVKPNRMLSDVLAKALAESGAFSQVIRELGEVRPEFILGGDMHAIEIYDSDDEWYAHLAVTLTLTRFSSGERLFTLAFDQRKSVPNRTFSQAARALSELLSIACDELVQGLGKPQGPAPRDRPTSGDAAKANNAAPVAPAPEPAQPEVIYVPEKR